MTTVKARILKMFLNEEWFGKQLDQRDGIKIAENFAIKSAAREWVKPRSEVNGWWILVDLTNAHE